MNIDNDPLPFIPDGELTRQQMTAWGTRLAQENEERALQAQADAEQARRDKDVEALAKAASDFQRARTINIALIAADALNRAEVGGRIAVYDENWSPAEHERHVRASRPPKQRGWFGRLLGAAQSVSSAAGFDQGASENGEQYPKERPLLLTGWPIEVVEKYRYGAYDRIYLHKKVALVLTDRHGPGAFVIAQARGVETSAGKVKLGEWRADPNRMMLMPDPANQGELTADGLGLYGNPNDATDLLIHMHNTNMYQSDACSSSYGCSPWRLGSVVNHRRYQELGLEERVEKATIAFLIKHGIGPEIFADALHNVKGPQDAPAQQHGPESADVQD